MAGIDAGSIYSAVRIRLDQLTSDINQVKTKLTGLNQNAQSAASGFESSWKQAFTVFKQVASFAAITKLLKDTISIFAGFEQSIANVAAVSGAAGQEMRDLETAARNAGETTRFSASQAADALFFLASAGLDAKQSTEALEGVLQLAGATGSDLAFTAQTLTAILSQYNLETTEGARVANVFAAANANSQATMEKLAGAFRQVGPVAAGLGLSLEQTTGALELLFNAGFLGEQSGRALKSALADLSAPTSNLRNVFERLGITMQEINPLNNDFADIIDRIKESGANTSDVIEAFGKVAGPQLAVLIDKGGKAIREYTKAVTGTNEAARQYAVQNDTLQGSLDFLKSKAEETAIVFTKGLSPGLREITDLLRNILEVGKPVIDFFGSFLGIILQIIGSGFNSFLDIFTGQSTELSESLKRANDQITIANDKIKEAGELDKTISNIESLTTEYENLTSKSSLTQKEQDRLATIIADLETLVPDAVTAFDDYGNAIEISGEKSRAAAKQLLETKKALLEEARTRLQLEKPVLDNIIRTKEAEATRIKEERRSLSESARLAEQRLAISDSFALRYEQNLNNIGNAGLAFNSTIDEFDTRLKSVGISLNKVQDVRFAQEASAQIRSLGEQANQSQNVINSLSNKLNEENKIVVEVEDAKKKLQELSDSETQLEKIQQGLISLNKVDPVDEKSKESIDQLAKTSQEFLDSYNLLLNEATLESRTFGDQSDVLKAKLDFLKSSYLGLIEEGLDPNSAALQFLQQQYVATSQELDSYTDSQKKAKEESERQTKINEILENTTLSYNQKLQEIGKTQDQLREKARDRALAEIEGFELSDDKTKEATDAINAYYDALANQQVIDEFGERIKDVFSTILSATQQLTSALISLSNSQADAQIEALDRELQATLEAQGLAEETKIERLQRELAEAQAAGNIEVASEKEKELKRAEITEDFERRKEQVKYDAALNEWNLKVTAAKASFASAILTAIQSAPFPWNLPAIGFATATGLIQIDAVNSAKPTPPTFQDGGIVPGNSFQNDQIDIRANSGERVLTRNNQDALSRFLESGNTSGSPIQITIPVMLDSYQVALMTAKVYNDGRVLIDSKRALK